MFKKWKGWCHVMTKKILSMVLAAAFMLPCGVRAAQNEDMYDGHWALNTTRLVFFASDGGTYIRPVEQEKGTVVQLDSYIPEKQGYIFQGWYVDPRTKEQQVTAVTLDGNVVVYAKWLDDGTPKSAPSTPIGATNEEIMAYGNYIDEKTGVPVTALWAEQNARLQELMQIYNENFNE